MKTQGDRFTRKMEKAVVALLEQPSMSEAAKAVGIGEVTLWRWMRKSAFQQQYQKAKKDVMEQAISRLQNVSGTAINVLREIMLDEKAPSNARVSACRTVLEFGTRALEIQELEHRVDMLEAKLKEVGYVDEEPFTAVG